MSLPRETFDSTVASEVAKDVCLERNLVPVYAAVVGSHAFGMATNSSDVDMMVWFKRPVESYLSLLRSRETYQFSVHRHGQTFEGQLWDVRKAAGLLCKSNAGALEALHSQHRVLCTGSFTHTCLNAVSGKENRIAVYYHYRGQAETRFRKAWEADKANDNASLTKHFLHAARSVCMMRAAQLGSQVLRLSFSAPLYMLCQRIVLSEPHDKVYLAQIRRLLEYRGRSVSAGLFTRFQQEKDATPQPKESGDQVDGDSLNLAMLDVLLSG